MKRRLSSLAAILVAAWVGFAPQWAAACSVCFGNPESGMTQGMRAGIWVLLGVTGVVLAGFVVFIVYLVRRARMFEPSTMGLEVIQQSKERVR